MSSGTRLPLQIDQQLDTVMAGLRTDVDALKTGVQFFGPDSLMIQRTGLTSGWDINASIAPYALKSYRFTFTSTTLKNPYVEFLPNIQILGGTGFEGVTVWPDTANATSQNRPWIVTLSNDANTTTFQVQAVYKCTDSGSVSVVAL